MTPRPSKAERRSPTIEPAAGRPLRSRQPQRCLWCSREIKDGTSVGRKRRYCGQSCRQRAYENRLALARGGLSMDAVVLTQDERDGLLDRLFQVRCAAEDVATAVAEGASGSEMTTLLDELLRCAKEAEVLH